jgi:hypothetical protein
METLVGVLAVFQLISVVAIISLYWANKDLREKLNKETQERTGLKMAVVLKFRKLRRDYKRDLKNYKLNTVAACQGVVESVVRERIREELENKNSPLNYPPPKKTEPIKFDDADQMDQFYRNQFTEGEADDLMQPLILENLPNLPPLQQRQVVAEAIYDQKETEHKTETK